MGPQSLGLRPAHVHALPLAFTPGQGQLFAYANNIRYFTQKCYIVYIIFSYNFNILNELKHLRFNGLLSSIFVCGGGRSPHVLEFLPRA